MGGVRIVLFSDLVDSTALLVRLGDDRMEELRRAHVEDVNAAVAGTGGRLVKTLGDGAMASFESALGALRAAAEIQASVERLDALRGGIGLAARVGVGVGEPIADGDDLHGMAVVIASRLCSAAAAGEVLVQDLVGALVISRDGVSLDPLRAYELKGVPAGVHAAPLRWRELVPQRSVADARGDRAGRGEGAASSPGIPLPRALAAYARESLIGRDREIAALREATAPRTGCRVALVLGEPGIGKTRHAAAAAAEAQAHGAAVVLARCPPEATIAFEPWVRAIGELARAGDEAWRERLARAAGAELAALVPELGARLVEAGQVGADGLVAAEGARYRLLSGIGGALACAAGDAPLLVVLDDAHWCDAASAQALGHLLERAPSERLVLVVTAREREMGRGHPVSRALVDLRRTRDLTELRLAGLDADGLATLVAARIGRAITPRVAARLHARTAGNPFFAAELAHDLDERGALGEGDALDAAPVPDAVTDLVEERLARLDPLTERLLVAVAAIGPSAPVASAARAAAIDAEEAERAVAQALSERLVDEVPATRRTVAFPHALIREALLAGVDDAARARLHLAIAQALEEDAEAEPAELARHHCLAAAVAGPARAIAACRTAAAAAAAAHDHEQAAVHLRGALALTAQDDLQERAALLLALGEQELLAVDLPRAREAYHAAAAAARATGDASTLALAALGAAGGDIGWGWEASPDEAFTEPLLREGLDALGDGDARLALRVVFRLSWALVYTDDDEVLPALARRAQRLAEQLGDVESEVLARFTSFVAACSRHADPLTVLDRAEPYLALRAKAEECGREDLLFRIVQWSVVVNYALGRLAECEREIERAAEIAGRLGSPRFMWEVDLNRAYRLLDRGDRAGGEALLRRAGATVRRLRPDIHLFIELGTLLVVRWLYDGDVAISRPMYAALEEVVPYGMVPAFDACFAALDGDHATARRRLAVFHASGIESLRRPDIHLPAALCVLALAATTVGDQVAGERLRPMLERMRPYLIQALPAMNSGHLAGWHIGRLDLLADRPAAAVEELRAAVARADALGVLWLQGWARADLAVALGRRDRSGDREQAHALLAEGEAVARQHGLRWVEREVALARARLEGREPPPAAPAPERTRSFRALATRSGRRALAAMVHGHDDVSLERRFADPRRQRALLRAMARGFQPAHAGDARAVIVYEIEPYAIEAPPDAPWRWAIEIDPRAGRARLVEPAPLDAGTTIHIGLADWVRTVAGVRHPVTVMAAGRCSVAGDVILAARLESMFSGADAG
jgi:class 3 adenylate cyclase